MEICAVIVWYNADEKMWANISKYLSFLDKIIIVDNSKMNNRYLIKSKSDKIIYIPNNENLGIAKALNQGCERAKQLKFEWVLTMDQDSYFEKKQFQEYLFSIKKILQKDKLAVSFSPRCSQDKKSSLEIVNAVITSGNILNLKIWEKVGKFDEKLFINEVDTIFGYKITENKYRIYLVNNSKMEHNVFDNYLKKVFFGKEYHFRQNDSPSAKYYMTRNSLERRKLFPKLNETPFYILRMIIKIVFFEHKKIKKLKMIYRGYIDYKKRKFGKFDSIKEYKAEKNDFLDYKFPSYEKILKKLKCY